MLELGKKIKDARISQKLSIKELSEKTKIRVYVIEAIEKGDFSVMPEVYLKSFLKTLSNFLKIEYVEPTIKTSKEKPKKFDDESIESKASIIDVLPKKKTSLKEKKSEKNGNSKDVGKDSLKELKTGFDDKYNNFVEIFKKSRIDRDKRYIYLNRTIYSLLILAVLLALYFGFKSLNSSSNYVEPEEISKKVDTIDLEETTNSLFTYFEKPDSIRLYAKSHDTVWIRVLSDGKSISEALLKPGMEDSWAAKEYFIVDLGNVGGVDIYRNEEKLPLFGKPGSVVKNIKITANEVLNTYSPKADSIRKAERKKKEVEEPKKPKMIEQSTIYNPSLTAPKNDSLRR